MGKGKGKGKGTKEKEIEREMEKEKEKEKERKRKGKGKGQTKQTILGQSCWGDSHFSALLRNFDIESFTANKYQLRVSILSIKMTEFHHLHWENNRIFI